jgi:hypothetical protein
MMAISSDEDLLIASVAATLVATAIRTDPRDGREYVYSQIASGQNVQLAPLTREGSLLATLPAGALLDRPLRLSAALAPEP